MGANADACSVWRWGDYRGRLSLSKIDLNAISDPHATMSVDPTLRAANDSGFPLQIAIERQVQNSSGEHGWTVRYSEHSWSNNEGQSGFIDMVLQDKYKSLFAVVECKRIRDAEWVFLHSAGRAPVERNAKGWVSHYASGSMKQFDWHELAPYPRMCGGRILRDSRAVWKRSIQPPGTCGCRTGRGRRRRWPQKSATFARIAMRASSSTSA